MKIQSLAFRLVIGAALWITIAVVAGGIMLSAVFRSYAERAFDAQLSVLLDALVTASTVDANGGIHITRGPTDPRFDQPYSGWYWEIMDDHGALVRSRSLWDQVLSPDLRLLGAGRFQQLIGEDKQIRLVSRDVTLPGSEATYHYVVSGDRSEIEREIRSFNVTLAWSLGALALGLIIAVLIQVRYGLLPLRRVRAALADVSLGRSDRLGSDYPAEVKPLVEEINLLLDNNAAVVARARTHVGNLAHSLKTPLSVLTNAAADPKEEGPLAEAVRRQVATMRRQVDHYLVRARTAATGAVLGARSEVLPVVDDLARTLMRIHAGRGIAIDVTGPGGLYFRGERQDLEEMLGNLIDNACKWAASKVRVAVASQSGHIVVTVDDDGPGLTLEEREAAFRRGKRLDEAVPGSGLGLSIVKDVAELYGGEVALADSDLGGLRAVLKIPAAEAAAAE
jgi:signal transduction histidine kinase